MANTYTTLGDLFTGIADAIRAKNGSTEDIVADTFPTEIANLRTGFDYNNSNVTEIPDYAFYGCEDLNSVNCYNLTSVGNSAFEGCSNLKTVILYDSVESVGENAFKGCSDLTIYCTAESKPDTWDENWNPNGCEVVWRFTPIEIWDISATKEDNVSAELYSNMTNDGMYSLVISGGGSIKTYNGFYSEAPWYKNYHTNINSIIIKNGVTSIGVYAFGHCTSLTSITIPDGVTSIENYAFSHCTSLTSITIPDGVTSIGMHAFGHCTSLTSITIPDSVTSIDSLAFRGCTNLTSIVVNENNGIYSSIDGVLFDKNAKQIIIYLEKNNTAYVIPDSVTSIGEYAFYQCTSLASITIPDSVTSIENHAFSSCTSLTSITIPDSVTSIEKYAFYGCTSLTSITIPDSVTSIGSWTFGQCTSLTSITYTGTTEQWNDITFGNSWNGDTGNYTIHCTDGDIAKDGTVTYYNT